MTLVEVILAPSKAVCTIDERRQLRRVQEAIEESSGNWFKRVYLPLRLGKVQFCHLSPPYILCGPALCEIIGFGKCISNKVQLIYTRIQHHVLGENHIR